ncbi:unnamed protein product [Zymoseptoria tritici ST99CH_1A5]|uniref:UBC core domain-containing protein n=3 Tax=Zymoseptoria tritici TaxID=1047171 RepID=F9X3T8_ZYMTI|nr:uncharacterized protein MYCGRDRAFT_99218 [Zymoseptoria tritici IPO323]EGP90401.1 hypothetical protein MYCGRDRAFT_99218 [Zymoseptoria tritici IPO323]SMR46423.1 unnamed protein product [Zymoseptoria tritici ST99CH_1E4]SMR47672.1 unnamed protein product [Zymoseptoria tritici ST99CH_3D1]SMY21576.1 unnamed protein product [Zymoseptoria tritici ST99CH_1A5]
MSSKNPTIKRILKEASELANQPSSDYHAAPLEADLFEWHFTLRGPPAPSPYEGGIYHGRIVLPPAYPLKPPSFRFLTPTGRFEVNREICLSISGHHEETWQPAWGIRTALVAIRSFMDTDAKGQVGGMDASDTVRRRFAAQSKLSRCAACGKTNEEIVKELDEMVKEQGGESKTEEAVPEQLRLAYREDLAKGDGSASGEAAKATTTATETSSTTPTRTIPASAPVAAAPPVVAQQQRQPPRLEEGLPAWIDKAIYGVAAALVFLLWKKYLL